MNKSILFFLAATCALSACDNSSAVQRTTEPEAIAEKAVSQTIASAEAPEDSKSETVDVYISAAARQCEFGGHSERETEKRLKDNGIKVLHSACAIRTGVMMPAVCGGPTNAINIHLIRREQLEAAKQLGFKLVDSLIDDSKGTDFELDICSDRGKNLASEKTM